MRSSRLQFSPSLSLSLSLSPPFAGPTGRYERTHSESKELCHIFVELGVSVPRPKRIVVQTLIEVGGRPSPYPLQTDNDTAPRRAGVTQFLRTGE
jgi:hypothetical protein